MVPSAKSFLFAALAAAMVAGIAGMSEAAGGAGAPPAKEAQMMNPYEQVDWDRVEYLHSFSHQHGRNPQGFYDMGFRHMPFSNYYPSRPFYPLPEDFTEAHPDALGGPNAEQHSATDSGLHFNTLGSFYTTGFGQRARIDDTAAPVVHEFTGLTPFDAEEKPWEGIYRIDVRIAPREEGQEAWVEVTVEGAVQTDRRTQEDGGPVQKMRFTRERNAIHLRVESETIRVRLDFDPATTRITLFRLMQGVNRPWRDAFRAALDGTLKDEGGRPVEGLQFPDGGGITVNHPWMPAEELEEMLDFDDRVLGFEVWSVRPGFGLGQGVQDRWYRLWDEMLRSGRRCFGFFVKDHRLYGRGRNVLLVPPLENLTREEREREALRAYREGRFFGLLGAMSVDDGGNVVAPYDYSQFRFDRIEVRKSPDGQPEGVEVAVTGADKSKRPNTQIRFVTDEGVAQISSGDEAYFPLPKDEDGALACRYVRVEAFAYPDTHLKGRQLTAEALAAMDVTQSSRLHDHLGDISVTHFDPPGEGPIAIVDMIFSQAVMFGE